MTDSAPTIAQARAPGGAREAASAGSRRAPRQQLGVGEPLPQHADAARAGLGRGRGRAVADAGLGQHELDAPRALPVAGERGDDRADLLVAGAQQERRRAAVALHADHVDARVGVAELVDAVRRHRAARVQVRVDERSERARRLDAVVEVEPQLAEQRRGRGGSPSRRSPRRRRSRRSPSRERRPGRRRSRTARVWKPPTQLDRAVRRPARGPSRRARRARAAGRRRRRRTCGPGAAPRIAQTISVARLGVAQRDEVEDRVERRVAAADDERRACPA